MNLSSVNESPLLLLHPLQRAGKSAKREHNKRLDLDQIHYFRETERTKLTEINNFGTYNEALEQKQVLRITN